MVESATVMTAKHNTDPHTDLGMKQVHVPWVNYIIFSCCFFVQTDARMASRQHMCEWDQHRNRSHNQEALNCETPNNLLELG